MCTDKPLGKLKNERLGVGGGVTLWWSCKSSGCLSTPELGTSHLSELTPLNMSCTTAAAAEAWQASEGYELPLSEPPHPPSTHPSTYSTSSTKLYNLSASLPCMCIFDEPYKSRPQCLENSSNGHSSIDMYKQVWQLVNQVSDNGCQDAKSLGWVLLKQL